jgi:hypothetical protein
MNEKIRQLYDTALVAAGKEKQFETTHLHVAEKFAELIVRECINQVEGQYMPVKEDETMMKNEYWKGYNHCGVDIVVAIREHFFGVEE